MEEELKSIFDEITKRIAEEEDNAIAKAFTLHIADLLKRNGINPILTKVEAPYEECSSANEYQLVSKYGYIFERLDTTEHDKKIIADEQERIVAELEEKFSLINKASKYGNVDAEQQNFSYSTMMMYEIADLINDAIEIVRGDVNG